MIDVKGVFIAIGHTPNTAALRRASSTCRGYLKVHGGSEGKRDADVDPRRVRGRRRRPITSTARR